MELEVDDMLGQCQMSWGKQENNDHYDQQNRNLGHFFVCDSIIKSLGVAEGSVRLLLTTNPPCTFRCPLHSSVTVTYQLWDHKSVCFNNASASAIPQNKKKHLILNKISLLQLLCYRYLLLQDGGDASTRNRRRLTTDIPICYIPTNIYLHACTITWLRGYI